MSFTPYKAKNIRVEIRDVTNHVGTYIEANFDVWVIFPRIPFRHGPPQQQQRRPSTDKTSSPTREDSYQPASKIPQFRSTRVEKQIKSRDESTKPTHPFVDVEIRPEEKLPLVLTAECQAG